MGKNLTKINRCYCNGDCNPSWSMNLTSCFSEYPAFVSLPYFCKEDPTLSNHFVANLKLEGLEDRAVVISRVSGKFPMSDNINDLRANLINGEDCISEDHTRWKLGKNMFSLFLYRN
ncbi:hypothetical protein M0804_013838 [Polistes exclamans]|nr:hypothetical protein M0804_013838 [Polistes exclamans]